MDDVGTIVYIIFLVLYLMSRALKKKGSGKKSTPPTSPTGAETREQPERQPMTFEELLKEFTEERKPQARKEIEEPPEK
jgi:hypothetical protein